MLKHLLILALLLPLGACTDMALQPQGDKVEIVDSISPTDLLTYERVAHLTSLYASSVELGRNDLRNQAAQAGAEVIRISSTEPAYCALDGLTGNSPKNCFTLYADAYRRKPAPLKTP